MRIRWRRSASGESALDELLRTIEHVEAQARINGECLGGEVPQENAGGLALPKPGESREGTGRQYGHGA